jgi:hypothetical protein
MPTGPTPEDPVIVLNGLAAPPFQEVSERIDPGPTNSVGNFVCELAGPLRCRRPIARLSGPGFATGRGERRFRALSMGRARTITRVTQISTTVHYAGIQGCANVAFTRGPSKGESRDVPVLERLRLPPKADHQWSDHPST